MHFRLDLCLSVLITFSFTTGAIIIVCTEGGRPLTWYKISYAVVCGLIASMRDAQARLA